MRCASRSSAYRGRAAQPAIQLPPLLAQLDTPLLRSMRVGFVTAGTLQALRAAALIREELERRGEVLQ